MQKSEYPKLSFRYEQASNCLPFGKEILHQRNGGIVSLVNDNEIRVTDFEAKTVKRFVLTEVVVMTDTIEEMLRSEESAETVYYERN